MSGHNFVRTPGGFVPDLSAAKRKAIETKFPAVPVESVAREAGFYRLWRDAIEQTPAPHEARDELTKLLEQIERLRKLLEPITAGPLARMVDMAPLPAPRRDTINELAAALHRASVALDRTVEALPEGRAFTARHRLTVAVARIVEAAGLDVDATPNGAVCQLVGHVLTDVGEQPTDVRKIVEPITRDWKKAPEIRG
jgi:hypothetical protein